MNISLIQPNRHLLALFVAAVLLAACTSASAPPSGVTTPALPSANLPTDLPLLLPSPASLTKSAIVSCPVSLPNVSKSPAEHYISTIDGYQNNDGTLFTVLWPGGKVIFSPRGPGLVYPDGSLGMKWPWYRTIPGEVIIDGRRLDAPAPPMPTVILRGKPDGYGETGFHPSGLIFPSEGCWEITGRVSNASLTFVTLVIKIPFEILQPAWSPEGLILIPESPDVTDLPRSIRIVYGAPDGGKVSFKTTQGLQENTIPYPDTSAQQVTVNKQPGVCVKGAWDKQDQWRADADAGALEWSDNGLSYQISYTGLKLRCEDLLRMAGSSP